MQWPWVSRKRFEDLERRLKDVDTERRTLLKQLLEREVVTPAPVSVEEDSTAKHEPIAFTTPFDSIGRRFSAAGASATKPQFKARVR